MPAFISDAELQAAGGDVSAVVKKAEAYIRGLQEEVETCRARADAAAITAEQNCALLEQKYISLTAQFSQLENEKSQLAVALDKRATELAQSLAQTHKLELSAIKKDSEVERLSLEVSELHKSKRELLEVMEQKSTELNEKNNTIKTYLDKIVSLTDDRGALEAKIHEFEAEITRSHAAQARLLQEKELIQKHNYWLNEELTSKVTTVLHQQQASAEVEADLSAKLSEAEKKENEKLGALQRSKEKVKELEEKLASTREELHFTIADAASKEQLFSVEVATASKLAELHEQTADEWKQKANELEGAFRALEIHLNQVEEDYKEKLNKEASTRQHLEKEAADLREKLKKVQADIETHRKDKESDALAVVNFSVDRNVEQILNREIEPASELHGDGTVVARVPPGISGTALAASLLRDGWSLATMYTKYQEAVDAWRHERQGRRQSQAILERVLHEIEEKAGVILDERAEHMRMIEAYSVMEQKVQQSMLDQANLDNIMQGLKADLRKRERDYGIALKEVQDLQTQVTVLLKECRDIQIRYGIGEVVSEEDTVIDTVTLVPDESAVDKVISDRLLTFKDIHGMVEQNCQLRSLVRTLGQQIDQREQEMKQVFDSELKKRTDEAASKVAIILKKSEEQSSMIESLQGTLGMYRRLYEEELRGRSFFQYPTGSHSDDGKKDLRRLVEISQESVQKTQEQASERIRCLEEDIKIAKHEAHLLRIERDRLVLEASYARERLESFMKDSEGQRNEMNAVLARNVEFSQMITQYQRRLRENSQSTQAAEEHFRKLSVEVSVLEREKEILSNAEKRASEEVVSLSEKVHRLQATLDTIQNVDEIRESSRLAERKRLEDDLNHLQREWAEAKQELQMERERARNLSSEKEQTMKQAMLQIESISKELANALREVSSAEARAIAAEARCADLLTSLKKVEDKASGKDKNSMLSGDEEEVNMALQKAREEIEQLKEDLQASKQHTEQFKCIAQANEDALAQIESAHEHFKREADKFKQSLEAEVSILKKRVAELEAEVIDKEVAVKSAVEEKQKVLTDSSKEIAAIAEDNYLKMRQIEEAQISINALKIDLEKEHQNWRSAQNNYERQVMLQAETIQELSKTSHSLETLQQEESELRKAAEMVKNEYESSKVAWEMEKTSLQSQKADAEQKFKEVDEQNKLLLDRLEAMHIKIAEKERIDMGINSQSQVADKGESDLQNVIHYLRRSKETADTEISLLKQERMRLQKQLESALHASETAQTALRRERENLRANIYTDEEFRSLQCQVTEMNLLRESNTQLREENKRNFEECLELRERVQHEQLEIDQLRKSLREKEIELDATQKELAMQKVEIVHWENRVSNLLEKYKMIDVEDYDRVKTEFVQTQEKLEVTMLEMESGRIAIAEKQERISNLENEIISKNANLCEMENKLQETSQAEATLKAEVERFRKQLILQKRRIDSLTKEKDEIIKEKQSLTKQIEELRLNTGKKAIGDLSKQQESAIRQEMAAQYEQSLKESENMIKEKDTRVQILEKTLEREREELRKEREELRRERDENRNLKARRQKDQKSFLDLAQKAVQEKKKFQDEFEHYKRIRGSSLELTGPGLAELSVEAQLDERAVNYLSAVDQLEEASNSVANDGQTVRSSILDTPLLEPPVVLGDVLPISSSGNTSTAISVTAGKSIVTAGSSANVINAVTFTSSGPIISSTAAPVRQSSRQALLANPQHSVQGSGASTSILPHAKLSDDKEQKIHQPKSILDEKEKYRKTGRRIIRPRIEPTNQQDSAIEADGSEMEAEVVEEGKSGILMEIEAQGLLPPSSTSIESESSSLPIITGTVSTALGVRKRLHISPTSQEDSHEASSEQDSKLDLIPVQKKARGMNLQEVLVDQGNLSFEITGKVPPVEVTHKTEEMGNAETEVGKKDGPEDVSELSGNLGKRNLEVDEPSSKRPRINRLDDSKYGNELQDQVKHGDESSELEKLDSSGKPMEREGSVEENVFQLDKTDSGEKRFENVETIVQMEDANEEEGEMQQSEKLEPSPVGQSMSQLPSAGDSNGKQHDDSLLSDELVENADVSPHKETEIEGENSGGLDVENDKIMSVNSPAEAIENGQIADTTDVEEGEIPVDLGDTEIVSCHLDAVSVDVEIGSHDEDKPGTQGEGCIQELGLHSGEITENTDQACVDLDQTSQPASVVSVSDAVIPDQSSHQPQLANVSDSVLDQNSQQGLTVISDAVVEDKNKVDRGTISSDTVQENTRAPTRSTTINLADRARERGLIRERERRGGISPLSVTRGRGRNTRVAKRGGGARGRGPAMDDSQSQ